MLAKAVPKRDPLAVTKRQSSNANRGHWIHAEDMFFLLAHAHRPGRLSRRGSFSPLELGIALTGLVRWLPALHLRCRRGRCLQERRHNGPPRLVAHDVVIT